MRAQRDREVHSGSARVKEIERPDVDGAAGKVNSSWGRRFNNHFLKDGLWSWDSGLCIIKNLVNWFGIGNRQLATGNSVSHLIHRASILSVFFVLRGGRA